MLYGFRKNRAERKMKRQSGMLRNSPFVVPSFDVEDLEGRRLLSAAHSALSAHHSDHHGGKGHGGGEHGSSEIAFSLAPAAVQTGLTSLASTDGDTAPTSTTEVYLGNKDGVETYTIHETSTGTSSSLTVDSTGAAVTAATKTTTTFGAITDTAVTSEISAIATALTLTAPTSTTSVSVSTASDGTATYSIGLTGTTTSGKTKTTHVSVDSSGNPVGNERVPLSVLSTTIQNGLTSNAPTGATALTSTSLINVDTVDGVTLYSTTYTTTGTKTTVSVNTAGALTSGTTKATVEFSTLPSAAQTELQTLATADGVATTIATTQDVTETTEANGTVLYTVKLTATSTTDTSDTYSISLTVDAAGNPTVLGDQSGHFGGGFC